MMDFICFFALLKGVRDVTGPESESGVFSCCGAVDSTGLSTGLRRASANEGWVAGPATVRAASGDGHTPTNNALQTDTRAENGRVG